MCVDCVDDMDCAEGEVCTEGECVPDEDECIDDMDCQEGEVCTEGECVPDNGNGGDPENGEALVGTNCAACHGADGASGFAPDIQCSTAEDIGAKAGGEGGHPMYELSDQDVLDIEAYLNSFAACEG